MATIDEVKIVVRAEVDAAIAKMSQLDAVNRKNTNTGVDMAKSIAGYTTGYNVAVQAAQKMIGVTAGLAKESLALAMSYQTTKTTLGVLFQSVEEGNKQFQNWYNIASKTPFAFDDISKAGTRLASVRIPIGEIGDKIKMLGDLAMGQPAKLERLSDAYAQLKTRGVASMEQINRFTESGVPIMEELAKTTGKTGVELFKLVEKGGVSFKMLDSALVSLTSQGGLYYGMMDKTSKDTQGKWSTALDNFRGGLAKVGTSALPAVNAMLDAYNSMMDKSNEKNMTMAQRMDNTREGVEKIIGPVNSLTEGNKLSGEQISALVKLYPELTGVMNENNTTTKEANRLIDEANQKKASEEIAKELVLRTKLQEELRKHNKQLSDTPGITDKQAIALSKLLETQQKQAAGSQNSEKAMAAFRAEASKLGLTTGPAALSVALLGYEIEDLGKKMSESSVREKSAQDALKSFTPEARAAAEASRLAAAAAAEQAAKTKEAADAVRAMDAKAVEIVAKAFADANAKISDSDTMAKELGFSMMTAAEKADVYRDAIKAAVEGSNGLVTATNDLLHPLEAGYNKYKSIADSIAMADSAAADLGISLDKAFGKMEPKNNALINFDISGLPGAGELEKSLGGKISVDVEATGLSDIGKAAQDATNQVSGLSDALSFSYIDTEKIEIVKTATEGASKAMRDAQLNAEYTGSAMLTNADKAQIYAKAIVAAASNTSGLVSETDALLKPLEQAMAYYEGLATLDMKPFDEYANWDMAVKGVKGYTKSVIELTDVQKANVIAQREMQSAIESGGIAIAESFGAALVLGEDGWKAFGKAGLNAVASVVEALAAAEVAKGIAAGFSLIGAPIAPGHFAGGAALYAAAGAIRAIPMAEGGSGTLTKATHFLAGEAGAEDYVFAPKSKGGLENSPVIRELVERKITENKKYNYVFDNTESSSKYEKMFEAINKTISMSEGGTEYSPAAQEIIKRQITENTKYNRAIDKYIPMAEGGEGIVTKPTYFLAGEAGPEPFAFGGANNKRGMGSGPVIVNNYNIVNQNIAGSIRAERELKSLAMSGMAQAARGY